MEKAILAQNRHWRGSFQNLQDRLLLHSLIKKLDANLIQIILGIRRSGKSSLFKLLINHLKQKYNPKSILYLNLDDTFFTEFYDDPKKLLQIVELSEKITNTSVQFLFLDEVQNVSFWEKFVKSAFDNEQFSKIFITGSNSSLLKGEYSQLLSGRYLANQVYPYSFKEMLMHSGINTFFDLLNKKSFALKTIDAMMEFGSFPEITKQKNPDLKHEILINYYETIILKDCIGNNRIREIKLFKNLAYYLISITGGLFTYSGLAKVLSSNENTIRDFIHYLTNGFLLYELKSFNFSLKKQFKGPKKIYCADNGILTNISFRFSSDKGKLFENLVFTELLKQGNDIYFYHNKRECDFITKKGKDLKAIQVTYELTEANKKRELAGVKEAMEKLDLKEGLIITYDQESEEEGIPVIPFWKYFF
jgi:predicted AAA+ superfamily ATPase